MKTKKILFILALLCAMVQGVWAQTEALKGKFTINAGGGQVKFSPGNLQATTTDLGASWTWGFASHQWDRIGNNTANNKINGHGTVSQNGTLDLFSWVGASAEFTGAAQYGITFTNDEDNMGTNASESLKSDWGELIGGGYRTLTADEWDYVFNVRESGATVVGTQNARYAHAVVNGVNGVILFPDGVNIALSEADAWGKINAPSAWKTECNATQWAALEAKGCVFLPSTLYSYKGYNGSSYYMQVDNYDDDGFYWSSTPHNNYELAKVLEFDSKSLRVYGRFRALHCAVRLVRDYEAPHVDSYAIADGDTYTATEDFTATSATYTKRLGSDRIGKYQAWLVPFDHTITSTDLQNFTFYKINMIANAPNPQTNASDEMWVFLKQLGEGDMLHANMPYVYKPLKAVTDYTFTTNNAVLKAKNTGVIADASTLEDIYSFYATYDATTATAQDPFYYVNIDGEISLGNDGTVSVGAFRWIIRVESKFGGSTAYARKMTFFDGESDVTGITTTNFTNYTNSDAWYTLDGRKLDGKPAAKGIYVNNGRKIVIK